LYINDKDVINHYKVLRVKKDENILVNFNNNHFICVEENISKKELIFKVIEKEENKNPVLSLTLYQGLPKKKKFEYILEKSVECGFTKIIPVKTRFVQQNYENSKQERFNSIVLNAAMQSKSPILPKLYDYIDLKDISADSDINIVLYENSKEYLKNYFQNIKKPCSISVVIGPEGGFNYEEIEILQKKGFKSLRLSGNILRTETACIAIGSIINYEFIF
ncbi:MAG: 16S rRNA (uracil(1498)-N(3))-methyltransferase, partial [Candidatus Muirbacterium halophilum]|nr:16S rRNA (uracil(1498)-N(3))-methyltransferase [Candidatus Muirbacterium halophilum]